MAVARALAQPPRLAALHGSGLLDSLPEPEFDRVTRLVRRLLGVPTALVALVDVDRQFFKSVDGLPDAVAGMRQTPLSHTLCQHVVATDRPLVAPDAAAHPDLGGNLAVLELGVAAYLGVPLHASGGQVIGSLCALAMEPREWSDGDLSTMLDLAGILESELALRDQAKRATSLAEANGVLAQEFAHRVRNAYTVAGAIISLSKADADSVEGVAAAAQSRLVALASVQDFVNPDGGRVNVEQLVWRLLAPFEAKTATCSVSGPAVTLGPSQLTPLSLFLHELATNSAKYGALRDGRGVAVYWRHEAGQLALTWSEPFDGATSSEPTRQGFGTRLLDLAARQLGGVREVHWDEGGLLASLSFPTPEMV